MKPKYEALKDGEWVGPSRNGYIDICCDCLLVHRVDYRIAEGGQIVFRAFRDNRRTAALRRAQNKTRAIVKERAHKVVKKMAQK